MDSEGEMRKEDDARYTYFALYGDGVDLLLYPARLRARLVFNEDAGGEPFMPLLIYCNGRGRRDRVAARQLK